MPAWNLPGAFVLILLAGIGSILVACVPTPDVITRPTGVPTLTRGADATSAPAAVQCEPNRPDAMGLSTSRVPLLGPRLAPDICYPAEFSPSTPAGRCLAL